MLKMSNDVEGYGIELIALTDRFKAKMKEISNTTKMWAKQVEANAKTNLDLDTMDSNVRLQELKIQLSNLKNEIKSIEPGSQAFREYATAIKDCEKEIESLNSELNNTSNNGKKSATTLKSLFNDATKSSRRFILSLFSIRSIWSLISRSAHSYLATNDALNTKVQLTSQIMGNILAPIIQRVVDLAQYGAIIVAKLIQMLTGFNALSNISAKNLTKVGKSAKEASKQLASFDTINNIGDNNSSASGIADATNAMKDFYDKVAKVEEIFSKYEDEIKAATIALGIFAGVSMLSKLGELIGSASALTGLAGVNSLLLGIAGIGVITIVIEGAYMIQQHKEMLELTHDALEKLNKKNKEHNESLKEQISNLKKAQKAGKDTTKDYEKLAKSIQQETTDLEVNNTAIKGSRTFWDSLRGVITDDMKNAYLGNYQRICENTDALEEQYKQGKLNEDQEKIYVNTLKSSINMLSEQNRFLDKNSTQYQNNKKKIDEMQTSLKTLTKTDYKANVKVSADTSNAKNKLNKFFTTIGSGLFGAMFPQLSFANVIRKIASLDVGTNYIPKDQLAMVHKGEMIVPKKFNPSTSGIGMSNDEVLYKLDELIYTIEHKNTDVYLDREKIGKSVINYGNNQSRILGRSVFN